MDSLAQSLLWLLWETHPDVDPAPAGSASALPLAPEQGRTQVASASSRPLRNRSLAIAVGAIVLGSGLGAPALANGHLWGSTVYVNTPEGYVLNVRWGPSTNNGVYRRAERGSTLQLSGARRNGWVELVDTTWVAGNLVSRSPVPGVGVTPLPDNVATVVTPQNLALNIRSGPGRNFPVVGQFVNGSRIELTRRFKVGWAQLTNGNWVDSSRIQYGGIRIEDTEAIVEEVERCNQPNPNSNPDSTSNDDVVELQRLLCQIKFLPPEFVVSGTYDQRTQNAVREFQRVNGLPVNGIVDAATWQALYRATDTTNTGNTRQRRVVTDGDSTSIFNGPGTEFGTIRDVPNGSIVTVTGRTSGNWSELVDGGWIFSSWLDPIQAQ